jgi:hypothetical protein
MYTEGEGVSDLNESPSMMKGSADDPVPDHPILRAVETMSASPFIRILDNSTLPLGVTTVKSEPDTTTLKTIAATTADISHAFLLPIIFPIDN